jgi:hypothetical protein
VSFPFQVGRDGYAEVFRLVRALKLVPMKGVGVLQGGTSPCHVEGIALLRIEWYGDVTLPCG